MIRGGSTRIGIGSTILVKAISKSAWRKKNQPFCSGSSIESITSVNKATNCTWRILTSDKKFPEQSDIHAWPPLWTFPPRSRCRPARWCPPTAPSVSWAPRCRRLHSLWRREKEFVKIKASHLWEFYFFIYNFTNYIFTLWASDQAACMEP